MDDHDHNWGAPTDLLPPVPAKRICWQCGRAEAHNVNPGPEWLYMGVIERTEGGMLNWPQAKGAGWWTLSDGSVVRGTKAAAERLEADLHG